MPSRGAKLEQTTQCGCTHLDSWPLWTTSAAGSARRSPGSSAPRRGETALRCAGGPSLVQLVRPLSHAPPSLCASLPHPLASPRRQHGAPGPCADKHPWRARFAPPACGHGRRPSRRRGRRCAWTRRRGRGARRRDGARRRGLDGAVGNRFGAGDGHGRRRVSGEDMGWPVRP